jgi:hypothetical protein
MLLIYLPPFFKHCSSVAGSFPAPFLLGAPTYLPYSLLQFNVCLRLAVSNLFKVSPEQVKTREPGEYAEQRVVVIFLAPQLLMSCPYEHRLVLLNHVVPGMNSTMTQLSLHHHKIVAIHGSYS